MTDDDRPSNRFEAAFRAWARRAPVTPADVAAKRVGARIDASSRHAPGPAVWVQRLAVACGLVLVVASGVLLWRNGTPPPIPSPAVEVPPMLPDNVVIFWLDAETPVYFIVKPVSDDPGGTP